MHHQLCALFKQSNVPNKPSPPEDKKEASKEPEKISSVEKKTLESELHAVSIDKRLVVFFFFFFFFFFMNGNIERAQCAFSQVCIP